MKAAFKVIQQVLAKCIPYFAKTYEQVPKSTTNPTMFFKLYKFNVDSWENEDFERSIRYLADSEKIRISKMKTPEAKRSASGHLICMSALAKIHGMDTLSKILFERTEENRPIWTGYDKARFPCLNFNISHSGNYVIAAIASHSVVGIDIQKISPRNNNKKKSILALKNQCTEIEWQTITQKKSGFTEMMEYIENEATEEEIDIMKERLTCFWVLKESFIKAIGLGLNYPLKKAEFRFCDLDKDDLTKQTPVLYLDGKSRAEWEFHLQKMNSDYMISIAIGPVYSDMMSKSFRGSLNFLDLDLAHIDEERSKFLGEIVENKFEFITLSDPFEEFDNEFD